MRVLYLSNTYTPHDYRFLSSLATTGHEIFSAQIGAQKRLLEFRELPESITQLKHATLEESFAWGNMFPVIFAVTGLIDKVQPDLIHAGPLHEAAFFATHQTGIPLVSMSWGSDILLDAEKSRFLRWITRMTLRHSSVLIGDCETVRRKAIAYGMDYNRIVTFPWGIDLDQFPPVSSSLPTQKNNFYILSTRHWDEVHNVQCVVDAFIKAARGIPQMKLLLLNDGPYAETIKSAITQAGMNDQVDMPGVVPYDKLPEYYARADIYVSASRSDGSSVSLMEAMASGLPSLVTDIESNKEWVSEGLEGWTFTENDSAALAERLNHAYKNRNDLRTMSLAARQKAEYRADWNKNFKILLHAYDLALGKVA